MLAPYRASCMRIKLPVEALFAALPSFARALFSPVLIMLAKAIYRVVCGILSVRILPVRSCPCWSSIYMEIYTMAAEKRQRNKR